MTPRSSVPSEATYQRALFSRIETLSARLETTEHRQQQLEKTVAALAREAGLSVGSPCARCNRSHLLMKAGLMYCPECGYRQSL